MRRAMLIFLLLFVAVAGAALAQKDCGDGLPCGKLLWDLPVLPLLPSPTAMPTIQITAIGTATAAPTGAATPTPPPTGTLVADFSGIGNQMNTLAAVVAATDMPVMVSGTPVSSTDQLDTFTTNAATFFGYLQGLQEATLGGWSSLLSLVVVALIVTIAIKGTGFLLPVVAVLFRLILRIVEVVKKLIGL